MFLNFIISSVVEAGLQFLRGDQCKWIVGGWTCPLSLSRASRLAAMLLCWKLCQKISERNYLLAPSVVSESSPILHSCEIKQNKSRSISTGQGNYLLLDFLRLDGHCFFLIGYLAYKLIRF